MFNDNDTGYFIWNTLILPMLFFRTQNQTRPFNWEGQYYHLTKCLHVEIIIYTITVMAQPSDILTHSKSNAYVIGGSLKQIKITPNVPISEMINNVVRQRFIIFNKVHFLTDYSCQQSLIRFSQLIFSLTPNFFPHYRNNNNSTS